MENLTHTLVGAALAETGLKRLTPLGTTTLLIAANLPDIDIVYTVFGASAYLEAHRGITHSIFGIPVLTIALAIFLHVSSRLVRERNNPGCAPTRFFPLLLLSFISMTLHPLLDYLNAYGWRPWLPFDNHWSYLDIVFVADPWIWIWLAGALFLGAARKPWVTALWGGLLLLLSLVLILIRFGWGPPGRVTGTVLAIWFGLVALTIVLKFKLKVDEKRAQKLGLGALGGLVVYLLCLTILHVAAIFQTAEAAHTAIAPNEQVTGIDALPTEINPFRWRAVVATEKAFYLADLYPLNQREPRFERYARETGDPAVIEAARTPRDAQIFLRFARFPVARTFASDGGTEVEFEDLRFAGLSNRFRIRIRPSSVN